MKTSWSWLVAAALGASAGVWLARGTAGRSRAAAASLSHPTEPAGEAPAVALPAATGARPSSPALAAVWDFLETLRALPADELPAQWEALDDSDRDQWKRRLLLARWVRLDPQRAAATLRGNHRWGRVLFAEWFKHEAAAAVAAVKQEEGEFFYVAFNGLWSAAQHEPKKFFQLAADEPKMVAKIGYDALGYDALGYDALSSKGIRALLAYSPEQTLALAATMDESTRGQIEAVWVETLAETDLDAAIARVKQAGTSRLAYATATALMPKLMEHDWLQAGDVLSGLEIKEDMSGLGWALLPKLREQLAVDPRQVADWINTNLAQSDWIRNDLLISLSKECLADHPAAALILREQDAFTNHSLLLLPSPQGDPTPLLAAASQAPAGAFRDLMVNQALDHWRSADPGAAAAWVEGLAAGEFKDRAQAALQTSGQDLAARVFQTALAGLAAQPDHPAYVNLLASSLNTMVFRDPAAAMSQVLTLPDGEARKVALGRIAATAASLSSPRDTLAWVAGLPDEADQRAALPAVTAAWTRDDPPAVSEWLVALEPGPVRDEAVAAFAENVWEIEPAAAVQWAATLAPGDLRTQTLEKILPPLLQRDLAAARAALDRAALTAEERAYWQNYQPTTPPAR